MAHLDSTLKSRDVTLPTKVHVVKATVFPVVTYGCDFLKEISLEYSGLISFRIEWFDLLVVQGTLKSLFQYHSSKASILQCSAFSIVQLSHPYMTTRKTISLTRQIFAGKVMSLLFNMLSRLVIAFLPRSRHLLISYWQTLSAVIFGAQDN